MSAPRPDRGFVLPAAFRIHFNDIDAQHEELVAVINRCVSSLEDGMLKTFDAPLDEFFGLLEAHFEHEEDLMRDLGYSGLDWHREHHKECLARIEALISKVRSRGYLEMHDLQICFHDVIHDIAHADLKFSEFVNSLGLVQQ